MLQGNYFILGIQSSNAESLKLGILLENRMSEHWIIGNCQHEKVLAFIYRKVSSSNMSHAGFFRLHMKGIFALYCDLLTKSFLISNAC